MAELPSVVSPEVWGDKYNEYLRVEHNSDGTHSGVTADTIKAKDPWADPRAFGAVGDGVANDTTAVQAAFDSGATLIRSKPSSIFKCTSPITMTDQTMTIEGGTFAFTSNNGFVYSTANATDSLIIRDVSIISKSAATGTALSASWDSSTTVEPTLIIDNLTIRGDTSPNTWDTGISTTNVNNAYIHKAFIHNPATLTDMSYGIDIGGSSVTCLIENSVINNADVGVRFTALYNNKVKNCNITSCNTGIFFDFTLPDYGAIQTVENCRITPIKFGIDGTNVIAIDISDNFFQKDTAGTWVGVRLDQTAASASEQVFESFIINNQFGNNDESDDWTGIGIITGRVILIEGNQFDSIKGTSISLGSSTTEITVVHNYNMQEQLGGAFIASNSVTNKVYDNYSLAVYNTTTRQDVDGVATPNIKNFLGNGHNGSFEFTNSGGAQDINGMVGGHLWQVMRIIFDASNITLLHDDAADGSEFNLQGDVDFTPPAGSVLTFQALPDADGWTTGTTEPGIVWTEIGRSTPTPVVTATKLEWGMINISSVADDASVAIESLFPQGVHGILTIFDRGGALVAGQVYIQGGGDTAVILSDSSGGSKLSITDVDGKLCILPDEDGTYSLKNRLGVTGSFNLQFFGAGT